MLIALAMSKKQVAKRITKVLSLTHFKPVYYFISVAAEHLRPSSKDRACA